MTLSSPSAAGNSPIQPILNSPENSPALQRWEDRLIKISVPFKGRKKCGKVLDVADQISSIVPEALDLFFHHISAKSAGLFSEDSRKFA